MGAVFGRQFGRQRYGCSDLDGTSPIALDAWRVGQPVVTFAR